MYLCNMDGCLSDFLDSSFEQRCIEIYAYCFVCQVVLSILLQ